MKTLYLALIILLAGAVLYLWLTRKAPEIVVGPSQKQLESFQAKAVKEVAKLKNDNDSLIAAHRHDSAMRSNQIKQDKKIIKTLTDRANSLLAQLNDSTPCCEASEIKSSVIALKDSIIEKQSQRILTDSAYIQNLQSGFDQRLAIEQRQREILEEENMLQEKVIEDQGKELDRRRKGGMIKTGVIGALVLVVLLL